MYLCICISAVGTNEDFFLIYKNNKTHVEFDTLRADKENSIEPTETGDT